MSRSRVLPIGIAFEDLRYATVQLDDEPRRRNPGRALACQAAVRRRNAPFRITREQLVREGHDAVDVANRMLEALRGRDLFADSSLDRGWISLLFHRAELPAPEIQPFDRLLDAVVRPDLASARGDWLAQALVRAKVQGAVIDRAYAHALSVAPKQHRAGADANHLYDVLRQALLLDVSDPIELLEHPHGRCSPEDHQR
jgi:hypothetical protein